MDYFNENDAYAAQWLRNLIDAGHLAPGVVDQRSILDVHPSDLRDFTQCHFFAGIGVWALALRRAGWGGRPVWTGSCPCQPFSTAGRGAGFADERHLWPHWFHLIGQCRPAIVLGEQVASSDAAHWLDLVEADMEALGYAFGACAFPSAGVGAPHIRDRAYWVAHAGRTRLERRHKGTMGHQRSAPQRGGGAGRLGHAHREHAGRDAGAGPGSEGGAPVRPIGDLPAAPGAAGGLADAAGPGRGVERGRILDCEGDAGAHADVHHEEHGPGPTAGLWADADWLLCRDGKWRPVEPGTFPLVAGATARVGRLRAYGNAINAEAGRVWIEAVMECIP